MQLDIGLIARRSTLMNQIVAKRGKPESSLVVSETRSSDETEMHVSEARCGAVPVLQAEDDHSTGMESPKVGIDEDRGRRDGKKNVQNIEHIRIGCHRQVHELLDLPVPQQGPDAVVFS